MRRSSPVNASTLRQRLRLIVLTDGGLAAPHGVEVVVKAALQAGAPSVQVRDKRATARELLTIALRMRELTARHGALLFVNDRVDVALAAGADGVHLGPDDLPVAAVRASVPDGFLIGFSADELAVAAAAVSDGADYIGCGAVYTTANKADAGLTIGVEGLGRVASGLRVPVVGIGGITVDRVAEVASSGAAGVAVIGAVMGADDPAEAVRRLLEPFETGA